MKQLIELNAVKETELLGKKLGALLRGGECVEFVSDLGGGKTTFIKSLVEGAGSTDRVNSPTFTISKQYTSGNKRFYHFDFYRLQEPGLVGEELAESLQDENAVVLIEWGQTVLDVLPKKRVVIEITKSTSNPEGREMVFTIPDNFSYLSGAFS